MRKALQFKLLHANTDNFHLLFCDKEAYKRWPASSSSIPLLSKCQWSIQADGEHLAKEAVGPGQDRASLVSCSLLLNHLCPSPQDIMKKEEMKMGSVGISAVWEDHLLALIW